MIDLEGLLHYLCMDIDINSDKTEITFKQTPYKETILQRFHIQNPRLIHTQIEPAVRYLLFLFEE